MAQDVSYRTYYHHLFLLVLFLASSGASFQGFYSKWHFREFGTTEFLPRVSFTAMVDGTADRPYVYRQLLPFLANWIDAHVSEQNKDRMFSIQGPFGKPILTYFFDSPMAVNRAYFLRYTIIYLLVAISAFISVWSMYLVARSTGQPPGIACFAAVTMMLLMPFLLTGGGYFYDYPELAFLFIAFWMSFHFDWWWMIPVVALAAWNKESFLLFLPTLYPVLRLRATRKRALIGIAVLSLICATVYLCIRATFRHNPGGSVEFHLVEQIESIITPSRWFEYEVTYGLLAFRGINLISAGFVFGTFWFGWKKLPDFARQHTKLAAMINVPFFLLFGYPGEIRTLSLIYVGFLMLIAVNLSDLTDEQNRDSRTEMNPTL